jgi:hypothetical protein
MLIGTAMVAMYVIIPRRHLYWLEATHFDGKRRAIACFHEEREAVQRLRELQDREDQIEQRCFAIEDSKLHRLHQ